MCFVITLVFVVIGCALFFGYMDLRSKDKKDQP